MLQLFHYIVVFVSGAVLMALEIAGSRVLAPHFGSSIFVWGSLISVVMTALSIGYYWGGWLSTREPSYAKLMLLLLTPGIVVFFLPFVLSVDQRVDRHARFRHPDESAHRMLCTISSAWSFYGHGIALRDPPGGDPAEHRR